MLLTFSCGKDGKVRKMQHSPHQTKIRLGLRHSLRFDVVVRKAEKLF